MSKSLVYLMPTAILLIGVLAIPAGADEPEAIEGGSYCMSNRSSSTIQWRDGKWFSPNLDPHTTTCVPTNHDADVAISEVKGKDRVEWGNLTIPMENGCAVINGKGDWCVFSGKSAEECVMARCPAVTLEVQEESAPTSTYCVKNNSSSKIKWRDNKWFSPEVAANQTLCVPSDHDARIEVYEIYKGQQISWGLVRVEKAGGCLVANGPSRFCIHREYTEDQCKRSECPEEASE
jgi:hypothetical protein